MKQINVYPNDINKFEDQLIEWYEINKKDIEKHKNEWDELYHDNYIPDFLKSESFVTYIDAKQGRGKSQLLENLYIQNLRKKKNNDPKNPPKFESIKILDAMEIMHFSRWEDILENTILELYENRKNLKKVLRYIKILSKNIVISFTPIRVTKFFSKTRKELKEIEKITFEILKEAIINFNNDKKIKTDKPRLLVIDNVERLPLKKIGELIGHILHYRQIKGMIILFAIDNNELLNIVGETHLKLIWKKIANKAFFEMKPSFSTLLKVKADIDLEIDDMISFDKAFEISLNFINDKLNVNSQKFFSNRELINGFEKWSDDDKKNFISKTKNFKNKLWNNSRFTSIALSFFIISYWNDKHQSSFTIPSSEKEFIEEIYSFDEKISLKINSDDELIMFNYIKELLNIDISPSIRERETKIGIYQEALYRCILDGNSKHQHLKIKNSNEKNVNTYKYFWSTKKILKENRNFSFLLDHHVWRREDKRHLESFLLEEGVNVPFSYPFRAFIDHDKTYDEEEKRFCYKDKHVADILYSLLYLSNSKLVNIHLEKCINKFKRNK